MTVNNPITLSEIFERHVNVAISHVQTEMEIAEELKMLLAEKSGAELYNELGRILEEAERCSDEPKRVSEALTNVYYLRNGLGRNVAQERDPMAGIHDFLEINEGILRESRALSSAFDFIKNFIAEKRRGNIAEPDLKAAFGALDKHIGGLRAEQVEEANSLRDVTVGVGKFTRAHVSSNIRHIAVQSRREFKAMGLTS